MNLNGSLLVADAAEVAKLKRAPSAKCNSIPARETETSAINAA